IDAGCQIIFATSFSYGTTITEMAIEYPDVVFCHATGSDAHYAGLDNLHNYFARIHEARYLAGIAAGLNTKNNKLGYVAAFPFAEVISGYTAFYLGAKSVNPDVTMDVMYANTWGDPTIEAQVAQALCDRGCDVISQHSDSTAPATTAERNGALHVGYNNDMIPAAPAASLISARIDWSKYMTYAINCVLNGEQIAVDWSDGLAEEAVYLSPLNTDIAVEGTQEAIDEAAAKIISGELNVFKGPLTTADGSFAQVVEYGATDAMFTFDSETVFEESTIAKEDGGFVTGYSAPLFNAIIEGISEIA
ncbi:MAG: BMP family ABC transporter substrate-binding protein, partial [Clostridia bacterium]|nr:BMP family ABC transporter substrate-binding protein [Clostridia bacterium]